ncbi:MULTISPECIES: hypothetical protein [Nocardiopsis]|uniref:Uncharacterized protein n=1 Tax=Nocardiopsis dassonvillei (strain ATCC 23218 / DSM 43111 / CIP 107115 / JCM 7437 / KCTC 9190 / NBRC 14626 / NCTC 10488 / NRRL B-5397 / IMRU 509) TaxID=446468 RepID=D7B354_NOCDD|nr:MULTISPECIES: hypothetical protein [Nocardiopsis]ADH68744.1 conserved hypothetical protein [Nocardiopsis dassonvillei subsp. dassonvillei DSM 43111]APC36803.1 hypothetical protein A9R04_19920 [Nocardiopsis dassonvillei]ASU59743.1 hypothetical protein CGQ36_20195 [Nocardiopsis dassonvillei]NKY78028.1 hypothetical protein [Nocardiopsis dassonvillei]VEI89253.1 Uncharacterised protein [Nocardiopsis dassonvillei]
MSSSSDGSTDGTTPAPDAPDHVKRTAIDLIEAYADRNRQELDEVVPRAADDVEAVTSELKVIAAFLGRRVQQTGVVWKPADSREAVARMVAEMLPPELEFAVSTAWEAHSVGEEEAAERFTRGDPMVYVHMLAAFGAAIGLAVYKRAELLSTLRQVTGLSE